MSERVVVLGALRTPIGKFLGSLSHMSAADLGVAAVKPLLEQTGVKAEQVDELIFGVGRQAGGGPNPARQVAIGSGMKESTTAYTLNMACGSGLLSIIHGAQSIQRGDAEIVVAGGSESMSRLPYYLEEARTGYRLGHGQLVDGMYRDGFHCPMADQLMGATAENLVEEYSIPRQEQDEYAVESQARCEAARKAGKFADEIAPIEIKKRKETIVLDYDEHPRDGVTIESMAKLRPVFKEEGGSVHPGNASGITDGGAAMLLASESKAKELGLTPLAILGEWSRAGVEPKRMGIGPVPAVRKLLEKSGSSLADYDLVEINEAFAAQVIACQRELEIAPDRLNVNGGAIALGHPIGATGCRIAITLLHEMKRRRAEGAGGDRGLATLCISGGLGLAVEFLAP